MQYRGDNSATLHMWFILMLWLIVWFSVLVLNLHFLIDVDIFDVGNVLGQEHPVVAIYH